eukprot:3910768-Lingulodinium_polyedra.AAC.1
MFPVPGLPAAGSGPASLGHVLRVQRSCIAVRHEVIVVVVGRHHAAVRAGVAEMNAVEDYDDPVGGRGEEPRLEVLGGHRGREDQPFARRLLLND